MGKVKFIVCALLISPPIWAGGAGLVTLLGRLHGHQ